MQWIPFAMVRITVVFLAGIFLGIYKPQFLTPFAASLIFLAFGLTYFLIYRLLARSLSIKILSGLLGLTTVFLAGYLNVFLKDESYLPDHLILNQDSVFATQVKLIGTAEEKEKSWKRFCSVEAILTKHGWRHASGKVNLYWPKTELVRHFDHGDRFLIKGGPVRVEAPLSPYEFDFQKFLGFKNIFHQQYVKHGDWKFLKKNDEKGFLFYAHRTRMWAVNALKKYIHAPHQQGIAIALVLGVMDGIDDDLRSAYAASGAMHVLAVSGLHVSIIYGLLLLIFRPLMKVRGGEWIIAVISLLLLWAYAFVTGLSPSVLRAVAMFSFMAVAKPFGRRTNIYNTLAASAFCLLLYDPFLIMSLGFQLSYLAVFGIVAIHRPLYNLWEAKSWLMDWVWQITCVSIAAQIATLPLTIYYFHQFPVYSLLSNLFVIPGSFVVLVGGIVLLIISPLSFIASYLGIALEWFVKIFNEGIFLVEKMPFSLIGNIYINPLQAWLLALGILSFLLLIQFKKFLYVTMLIVSAGLFSVVAWIHHFEEVTKPSWTVHAVKGHSAMTWKENSHAWFLADSAFMKSPDGMRFHIQPDHLVKRISEIQFPTLRSLSPSRGLYFYVWKGKAFLWVQSKPHRLPKNLKVDYLVISNNAVRSLHVIAAHISFGKLIFDGSNSFRYYDRLVKEAQSLNLDQSFVLRDGSFTVNL